MPDGVRLSMRLWLPERSAGARLPVVLELIPYRKRDSYRDMDDAWGGVLAAAGVAFARVDVRGTGDSEGVLIDEYSEQELQDGEACIAWLAACDWCNGRVGMRGISWGGINTLMIAARQPAALKAIVPMAAADNRFTDDAHYVGGRIGKPNLDWGVLFKSVLAGPPDPAVVGDAWEAMWHARLAATPAVVTEWLRHQHFDAYWQRGSVCLAPGAIRCPVLLVAGWQDTYVNFIASLLHALAGPKQAVIGPWGHTYPGFARPQGINWAAHEIRFWHRWLLAEEEEAKQEESKQEVANQEVANQQVANQQGEAHAAAAELLVFLPEQTARQSHPEPVPGRWRSLSGLPASCRQFRLGAGVLLADEVNEADEAARADSVEQPDSIQWRETEPVGFATAEWLDRLPEEQSRDDALSLCFDSVPLSQPLTLLGRATLSLGQSTVTGRGAAVRLCDVDAEGRSWLVSYAWLEPDHTAAFRLAGYVFLPGHRLRLSMSGGLWPMTWPAPEPMEMTLDLSDCRFTVPVLEASGDAEDAQVREDIRSAAVPPALPAVVQTGPGAYRYEVEQPAYEYVVESVGTRLSGEGAFVALRDGDGQSSWQTRVSRGWHRSAWDCSVEARVSLERVEGGLRVEESLRAFRDDQLVFERNHIEQVADPDSVCAD